MDKTMKKVILSERVKVVGTGKSANMPKGVEYEVHPLHAEKLVKAGKASYAGDPVKSLK